MSVATKNKYSSFQNTFFDSVKNLFVEKVYKFILLSAVAGSGKTFSIIESLKFIPRGKQVKMFAFNKTIAEEFKEKVNQTNVDTSTVHSFGMRSLAGYIRKAELKVTEYKSWGFIESYMKDIGRDWQDKNEKTVYIFDMMKLIDMWRLNLCERDTRPIEDILQELILKYDVSLDKTYKTNFLPIWNSIKKYNDLCINGGKEKVDLDFVDMIYLPVAYPQVKVRQFDIVYVDECQDLSRLQQEFVLRSIKSDGFGVWVGDPCQAIYAFAGADSGSFAFLSSQEKTLTLPLSVNYRSGKKIVEKAALLNPQIKAWEQAEEGIVKEGNVFTAEEGDFILCRNVRPLIKLWFHFIGEGKKSYVRGKELGKSLISLVNKVKEFPKDIALEKLLESLHVLEGQLIEAGVANPRKHKKYVSLDEDIRTILLISTKFDTMSEVSGILDKIFSDDPSTGVQLMTIHKSKGLENDKVFLCRLDLIPSKYAIQDYQKEQERNLLYVAFTRAKKELIIDKTWKD